MSGRGRSVGRGRRRRGGPATVLVGDRPYLFALGGLLVLLAAMAVGPLQSYTTAADQADSLAATRGALAEEVAALEDRHDALEDPEQIEIMARSELGLIKPGEIPFVVVDDDDDLDRVGPDESGSGESDDAWYRRLGRTLSDWLNLG